MVSDSDPGNDGNAGDGDSGYGGGCAIQLHDSSLSNVCQG
jgi:hypothetical protein